MKHFFTLIIGLMAVLTSQAQTIEIRYQGQSVADGSTITIAAEEDAFGVLSCETNPASNPNNGLMLKLVSGSSADIFSSIEIAENTMNAEAQWCIGGECVPFPKPMGPVNPSLEKNFTLTGEMQVQFDAINIKETGHMKATLIVINGEEAHYVDILFTNGESAGLSHLTSDGNPQTYYSLSGCRTDKPSKGIYITGRRKVIIK